MSSTFIRRAVIALGTGLGLVLAAATPASADVSATPGTVAAHGSVDISEDCLDNPRAILDIVNSDQDRVLFTDITDRGNALGSFTHTVDLAGWGADVYTVTLTCTDGAGAPFTTTTTFTIEPPAAPTLTASSVPYGGSVEITSSCPHSAEGDIVIDDFNGSTRLAFPIDTATDPVGSFTQSNSLGTLDPGSYFVHVACGDQSSNMSTRSEAAGLFVQTPATPIVRPATVTQGNTVEILHECDTSTDNDIVIRSGGTVVFTIEIRETDGDPIGPFVRGFGSHQLPPGAYTVESTCGPTLSPPGPTTGTSPLTILPGAPAALTTDQLVQGDKLVIASGPCAISTGLIVVEIRQGNELVASFDHPGQNGGEAFLNNAPFDVSTFAPGGYDAVMRCVFDQFTLDHSPAPFTVTQAQIPTNDAGDLDLPATPPAPGSTITISGDGFFPSEDVPVIIFSTPVVLGTLTADADGRINGSVTLPSTIDPGAHTIVARGAEQSLVTPITIAAQVAPTTTTTTTAAPSATTTTTPATASTTTPTGAVEGTSNTGGQTLPATGTTATFSAALAVLLFGLGYAFRQSELAVMMRSAKHLRRR